MVQDLTHSVSSLSWRAVTNCSFKSPNDPSFVFFLKIKAVQIGTCQIGVKRTEYLITFLGSV